MKKVLLFTFFLCASIVSIMAQSPCYTSAFNEGKSLFQAGKYNQAKKLFNDAKSCPNPNTVEVNDWIAKCDKAIAEAALKKKDELTAKKKKEQEAAKTAYMNILRMDYCNVDNSGRMIDDYGSTFYPSKMKCLLPRITYNSILDETKGITLYVKIYNPSGALVKGKDYTYSASMQVEPGKGKTHELPKWDNNGMTYAVGTYRFELWYDDRLIHSSSFKVEKDLVEPEPQIVYIDNSEKKAEIIVSDKDGNPLEGAKILIVATGKYEWTNSDGVGKIDMSDNISKRVEITHPDYKDKKELTVYADDKKKVAFFTPKTGNSTVLNVAKYVVPGLGQWQAGNTIEGAATLGGEVVLLTTGLISNSIAKKHLKVMQNDNVTLADFQSANKKYKAQRTVNIICYTSAVLVYGFHLYRTFTLPSNASSGKRLSLSPAVINADNEMALGMSINLTF